MKLSKFIAELNETLQKIGDVEVGVNADSDIVPVFGHDIVRITKTGEFAVSISHKDYAIEVDLEGLEQED